MEFSDVESCVQDFSDLGREYKVLEVSVPMMSQGKGMIRHYRCRSCHFNLL